MALRVVVGAFTLVASSLPCLWGQGQVGSRGGIDSLRPSGLSLYLPNTALEVEQADDAGLFPLPSVVETKFVYNARDNVYLLSTYYQGRPLSTPIAYSPKEFMLYIARRQEQNTYKHYNRVESNALYANGLSRIFDNYELRRRQPLQERLFGPGGLKLSLTGAVELNAGLAENYIDNPTLGERGRHNKRFDFGQKIEASLRAKLGTKLSLEVDYNTESALSRDAQRLSLNYKGGEDDIVKLIEAGYVSMKPRNSLIDGTSNVLGLHSQMQFGPLTLDLLMSRQRSEQRRIEVEGHSQRQSFELSAADYDEGRHFFLSDFFRSQYDQVLARRPLLNSGVRINRIEVWVTNRRARYDEARHLVAFADLGEHRALHNSAIRPEGRASVTHNTANSLYRELQATPQLRHIAEVSKTLPGHYRLGWDYDKLESARLLRPEEYVLNERLGYISLLAKLQPDEVLAVAYEYTYNGEVYQVGEFGRDIEEGALFLKLLKGRNSQAQSPYWHYMMRNVYALGHRGRTAITADDFKLDVYYRSDATGGYVPYLPTGNGTGQRFLDLLGLDRINSRGERERDGRFDYIDGLTIEPKYGWVYLPSVSPFEATLEQVGVEPNYRYPELYTQSPTEAKKFKERNRYQLRGSYRGNDRGVIPIGSWGGHTGAVRVEVLGRTLVEGVDYLVDYSEGTVTITNEQLLLNKEAISVRVDEEGLGAKQRQSLLGVDLNYRLGKHLQFGATAMYMREQPLMNKLRFGQEPMSNWLLGTRLAWQSESPWLQRLLERLSLNDAKTKSYIQFEVEYARLLPALATTTRHNTYTYIDDFEHSRSEIDLKVASAWSLCSVPEAYTRLGNSTSLEQGFGRGHLSWFTIDPLLTREHLTQTPKYIKAQPNLVSHHYVREVEVRELYPNREQNTSLLSYIPTLNMRFYPRERGMYNLNVSRLGVDGLFQDPEQSWAGIMRRLEVSDFEQANVEYLEFWLMDPLLEVGQGRLGGDLYINIGDISEDILPDERKSYENGIAPSVASDAAMLQTPWGLVPKQSSMGYSFDNSTDIASQDVGLDGLSNEGEILHPSYQRYRQDWERIVSRRGGGRDINSYHSPQQDPAGDDFRHYMDGLYDQEETPILERYKYFNGLEGNSRTQGQSPLFRAARSTPDTEDINLDNNLNEVNRYYEYKVSLRPHDLRVGRNHVVSSREVEVQLRNGERSTVTWYQFRIPLKAYERAVGGIGDMQSMRFMRMYLSGFRDVVHLRFGSLKLQRGDWRSYDTTLDDGSVSTTASNASVSLSAVNIEEHTDRKPINYVLPPGVSRSALNGDILNRQENEQALAVKVSNLAEGESQAIYRNMNYDLRRYKKLQLWLHAEQLPEEDTGTNDGDLEFFVRLGSDAKYNYYEYTLPIKITPPGVYSSQSEEQRAVVWPYANLVDIDLEDLVHLKLERNQSTLIGAGQQNLFGRYTKPSGTNREHLISVVGNPSLSQVETMLLGVRNRSNQRRNIELWLNELRLDNLDSKGADALKTRLDIQLSDFASLQVQGDKTTAGFGGLYQRYNERQQEDRLSLGINAQLQMGKFLPKKAQANIPFYIRYSVDEARPEYSPRDTDVKLEEALEVATTRDRALLRQYSLTKSESRHINLVGMQLGIRSKQPMPYDPANFKLNFNHSLSRYQSPEFRYKDGLSWQLGLQYEYAPSFKALRPFSGIKSKGSLRQYLKQYTLNLWPQKIGLQTQMMRHYEEEQLRNQLGSLSVSEPRLSYAQQFIWQRKMNIQWQFSPNLMMTLQTGTDARIEAPNVQVNRSLNPDDYSLWREAVDRSIRELGTPQKYQQQATATYTLPTQAIKMLRWVSATTTYNSTYQWDLGAYGIGGELMPNTIANQMDIAWSAQFNFKKLYQQLKSSPPKRLKKSENNLYKSEVSKSSSKTNSLGEGLLNLLMMLKELNISVKNTKITHLPGYMYGVANAFGQRSVGGVLRPGWAYALGLVGEDFISSLNRQGAFSQDPSLALSGVYTTSRIVDVRANVQPIKDFNITLTANHTENLRKEYPYSMVGALPRRGGDMQMTTIGLRGIFDRLQAQEGYNSAAFNHFVAQTSVLSRELATNLQARGINSPLDEYNPIALLTAFRNVYMGQGNLKGSAIPRVGSMLPNWSISYNGLSRWRLLSKLVRMFSLKHSYRGIFRVNNYDSFVQWRALDKHWGLVPNLSDPNTYRLTWEENLSSVSLSETFFPLLGADVTFKNGLTLSQEWRRSRNLTLNLSSLRLIESQTNEWHIAASYHIVDLSKLWKPRRPSRLKASNKGGAVSQGGGGRGLTLKFNYNYRSNQSLIRQISQQYTQATSGTTSHNFSLNADYELSRFISLRAYYELTQTKPLVSTTAFPAVDTRYGVALRINLSN